MTFIIVSYCNTLYICIDLKTKIMNHMTLDSDDAPWNEVDDDLTEDEIQDLEDAATNAEIDEYIENKYQ